MDVFDRLRQCFLFFSLVSARVIYDPYNWTLLSAFYLGWLAAPLTHLLLDFVVCFLEGRQSWLGGIGVARAVVGALVWFWSAVSSNYELVSLLVT